MRVLAIEPFCGGSHRAFLEGWRKQSEHQWDVIGYSPHHWKWRMRHAAFSAAVDIRQRARSGGRWDVLFCSDMLNLAELRGLATEIAGLPAVAYFHENQVTYPVRDERERDRHFAVSNFATATAADAVWFNSAFHRDEFLSALPSFFQAMPDHRPDAQLESLAAKCEVQWPGVDDAIFDSGMAKTSPTDAPPQITWAARWEFDKNPDAIFHALNDERLAEIPWSLNVLGQQFSNSPACFAAAKKRLGSRINEWGHVDRGRYLDVLQRTDIFVSTAIHEFFGIAAVEAIASGATPLLPKRLAYPELLSLQEHPELADCFYETDEQLAGALIQRLLQPKNVLQTTAREQTARFAWSRRATAMDRRLMEIESENR